MATSNNNANVVMNAVKVSAFGIPSIQFKELPIGEIFTHELLGYIMIKLSDTSYTFASVNTIECFSPLVTYPNVDIFTNRIIDDIPLENTFVEVNELYPNSYTQSQEYLDDMDIYLTDDDVY